MNTNTKTRHSKALRFLEEAFENLDEHDPDERAAQNKIASAIELLKISVEEDWTKSKDGRSNSSSEFDTLVHAVEQLIREQAHALINGRIDAVAHLIMAQLAHVWKLVPMETPICRHKSDETFCVPCPKCGRSTDWSGG